MKLLYSVTYEDSGKLLKDILKKKLYISNILMKKLKMTSSIFVNDIPVFINAKVFNNDKITIDFDNLNNVIYNDKSNVYYQKEKFLDKYPVYNIKLDIIYEDDYLLIVNKPAKIAVHPSCANYDNALSNAVAFYLQREEIFSIHIVTRLDKNTSGICIFAKNEYVQELFIRKKDNIKLIKEYIAIVNNIIDVPHGIIEKPISRKKDSIILREVSDTGDYAKTEYFLKGINKKENYSILKILLHTGRTHQIRVHMASIGYVLLGDTLYSSEYGVSNIDKLITRQALHAYKISFYHPITNKYIELVAPIPDDIQRLI